MSEFQSGLATGLLVSMAAFGILFVLFIRLANKYTEAINLRDQRINVLTRERREALDEHAVLQRRLREMNETPTKPAGEPVPLTADDLKVAELGLSRGAVPLDRVSYRMAIALRATGALDRIGLALCDDHERLHRIDRECESCHRERYGG